jgi:hypothetical protein
MTNFKLVPGEARVLKKGGENLFHFLDETTVANHDRSCASFSLTVSVKHGTWVRVRERLKKGKIFLLVHSPQDMCRVILKGYKTQRQDRSVTSDNLHRK